MDSSQAESAKAPAPARASPTAARPCSTGCSSIAEALSSLVFFLALTALSLFFLLKDGPADPQLGPSATSASRCRSPQTISQRMLQSLRGYFLGVTIVAAFNAVVVAIGAADPRRSADRDDRGGHLHRRLHPVPRARGARPASRC